MLCDDCHQKPANVHIKKIVNDQQEEKHLCEECAKKSGDMVLGENIKNMFENNLAVAEFVKAMFTQTPGKESAEEEGPVCPACGLTYQEFSSSGKLGCGKCYQAFAELLAPLLKKFHGGCSHTGKIPKRAGGALGVRHRIKCLRLELERFVLKEEYEQAAIVRDQIREMEKQLSGEEGAGV